MKVKRFGAKIKNKVTPKLKWGKTGLRKKEASEESRVEHRCLDNVQKQRAQGCRLHPLHRRGLAGSWCRVCAPGLRNEVIKKLSWIRRMRLQGKNKEIALGGCDSP